jgi:hypothetical protein
MKEKGIAILGSHGVLGITAFGKTRLPLTTMTPGRVPKRFGLHSALSLIILLANR